MDRAGRVHCVLAVSAEESVGAPVVIRRGSGGGRRLEAVDVAPVRAGGGAGDGRCRRRCGSLRNDVAGRVGGAGRVGREAPRLGRRGGHQEGQEVAEEYGRRLGYLQCGGLSRFAEVSSSAELGTSSRSSSSLYRVAP